MLITKEQQEAMIEVYAQTHSGKEILGFYDGMIAILELIEKLDKNGSSQKTTKKIPCCNGFGCCECA